MTYAKNEAPILCPPDAKADSLEKTLMLGMIEGEEDSRGLDGWMASLIQWTGIWANWEMVRDREA